jgi:hypothetical protein
MREMDQPGAGDERPPGRADEDRQPGVPSGVSRGPRADEREDWPPPPELPDAGVAPVQPDPKRRRRLLRRTAVLALALIGWRGWVYVDERTYPDHRPSCAAQLGDLRPTAPRSLQLREPSPPRPTEPPPAGYELVWVALWDAHLWRYSWDIRDNRAEGRRVHGAYWPGEALDKSLSVPPGELRRRDGWGGGYTRLVVVPRRAWSEHVDDTDRLMCTVPGSARVHDDMLYPGPPLVQPGSWVVARRVGVRTVVGEALTEFEMPLRAIVVEDDVAPRRFWLDAKGQLRRAEAWIRFRGFDRELVRKSFEIWPAPGESVEDPSDEPIAGHSEPPVTEWRSDLETNAPPERFDRVTLQ